MSITSKSNASFNKTEPDKNQIFLNLSAKNKQNFDLISTIEKELMSTAKNSKGKDPVNRMIEVVKSSKKLEI